MENLAVAESPSRNAECFVRASLLRDDTRAAWAPSSSVLPPPPRRSRPSPRSHFLPVRHERAAARTCRDGQSRCRTDTRVTGPTVAAAEVVFYDRMAHLVLPSRRYYYISCCEGPNGPIPGSDRRERKRGQPRQSNRDNGSRLGGRISSRQSGGNRREGTAARYTIGEGDR